MSTICNRYKYPKDVRSEKNMNRNPRGRGTEKGNEQSYHRWRGQRQCIIKHDGDDQSVQCRFYTPSYHVAENKVI